MLEEDKKVIKEIPIGSKSDENDSSEDAKYRSLEDEKSQEVDELSDAQIDERDSNGYSREKEKSFNPVSNEKETDKDIEESKENDRVKSKVKSKNKNKQASLFANVFRRMTHLFRISFLLDDQNDERVDKEKAENQEKEIVKINAYKHYAQRRPGDQAGIFDKDQVAKEQGKNNGKKTLATFFELDPSMSGMSMNNEIGLTAAKGNELTKQMSKEQEQSQDKNKHQERLREREMEIERAISRDRGGRSL